MGVLSNAIRLGASQPAAADDAYQIEKSLRFNPSDSAYLSRTFSSTGSQRTWTLSYWVKKNKNGEWQWNFCQNSSGTDLIIGFRNDDTFGCQQDADSVGRKTTAQFRDPSAWYHFLIKCNTTSGTADERLQIYCNGVRVDDTNGSGTISQNHPFPFNTNVSHDIARYAATPTYSYVYLANIHFVDGSALDPSDFTETNSTTGQLVPIEYTGSYGTNGFHLDFSDNSSNTATTLGKDTSGNSNNWTPTNINNAAGIEYSASSRFTAHAGASQYLTNVNANMFDSSENTYVSYANGNQPNSGFTWSATGAGLSGALTVKTYGDGGNPSTITVVHAGGTATVSNTAGSVWSDMGTLTGIVSIDVNRHDQGICHGIKIGGVLITNGSAGDQDSLRDSPTNGDSADETGAGGIVPGNYCTINPLDTETSMHTLTQGNLKVAGDTTAANGTNARWNGTFGASSGKWYYEVYIDSGDTNQNIGISSENGVTGTTMGNLAGDYQYTANGNKRNSNSSTSWGNTYTTGDYVGVAYDLDANKIWFSKNGVWQENGGVAVPPVAGSNECFSLTANKIYKPAGRFYNSTGTFNFGQREFEHSAPTGFKPLATAFLPDPAIAKPKLYFDIALYTGTGSSRSITDLEFEPGFIYIKKRNAAEHPIVYDQARGTEKALYTSGTWAEGEWTGEGVSAFNSDGFTIGTSANANSNGDSFVAWCWQSGETAASASTAGATNATDSWVNTTAKFSLTEWEGTGSATTVGHSLGTKPDFIIVMNRDYATNKAVYHSSLGAGKSILLNSDGTAFTPSPSTAAWNNTEPTDTVFSVGTYNSNNGSGHSMIAYSWAAVPGYSAFGSYEGNASTNGSFVYCGFRPRFILIRNVDDTQNWHIHDTERNPSNVTNYYLFPNKENGGYTNEGSNDDRRLDILSNGFKLRETAYINSAHTHIYAAFAELPFKYSRAR